MSAITALPTTLPRARPDAHPRPRPRLEVVGPGFVPTPGPAARGPHPAPVAAAPRPAPARPARTHLTARGRAVLAGAAFVLATALAVLVGAWAGQADVDTSAGGTERVTVTSGDTLWGIAAGVAAPGEDVREVVDELLELNALTSADVRAGQQLLVPAR